MSQVALVTGGSRSIGAAVVDRFARSGMTVYFNYLQDHDAAQERIEANSNASRPVIGVQADLRSGEDVARLISMIAEKEGRLDIVVANAASGVFRNMDRFSAKHWNWTFDTNAKSFMLLVQAALPMLKAAPEARVIALSGLGAERAIPSYGLVGASKAALEALVRQLAVELSEDDITVNAVAPGLVKGEGVQVFMDDGSFDLAEARTPARRLVRPDDVAAAVSFLCSAEASMIRGHTLVVDGGYRAVA